MATIEDATARLARITAAATDPTIDETELVDVLALNAFVDDDGRLPDDPEWSGAWDLNAAAADIWRQKAALASSRITFTADGATFQRDIVFRNCLSMASYYGSRAGTIIFGRTTLESAGWLQSLTTYTDPTSVYIAPDLLP
jgi:hypothetical protein